MLIADLRSPKTAVDAGAVQNSWVLPDQKIVYVSIGKNACTSIKWLLAEISGQDVSALLEQPSEEPTRRNLIHLRKGWRNTPRLSELSPAVLSEISPSTGWFVFAVVRDPRLRLFSAWQSKFLIGDPAYFHQKWAGRDWLPRVPRSSEDVLADWRRFVEVLTGGSAQGAPVRDGHFAPQTERLAEKVVPYSRIYEISELRELTGDLTEHVARTTGTAPELVLGRENETPLPAGREVFDGGIRERIEAHYASDFARFGHVWPFDEVSCRPVAWSPAMMTDIAARRAIHERVMDLREMVRTATRRSEQLSRELDSRNRTIARLEARVGGAGPTLPERILRRGARAARAFNQRRTRTD